MLAAALCAATLQGWCGGERRLGVSFSFSFDLRCCSYWCCSAVFRDDRRSRFFYSCNAGVNL
jgi:hypothetical protein